MMGIDAKIDEFMARSKALNGREVQERVPWHTTVTADAIRHFAYGISDDNPLWLEPDYAAKSRYGQLVAPPAFLTSVLYPILYGAPMQLPLSSFIDGLEYRWYQPVLAGDTLRASSKQQDVYEVKDQQGHRRIYILSETTYWNQREEIIGKAVGTLVWMARTETELLLERPVYSYTEAELQEIHDLLLAETRQGNQILAGDKIKIGQKLPPFVRGPLTIGDLICWQAATGPSYRAGALGYRDTLNAPHTAVKMPTVGWPVNYSQQHEDFSLACQHGMPAPFDNGVMRFAWLSVMLTNWIGDAGFLKRLHIQINEPILYGDTTWYEGSVTGKINNSAGTLVQIKITGANQIGQMNTIGEAEILLPAHTGPLDQSRSDGQSDVVSDLIKVESSPGYTAVGHYS